MIKKNQNRLKVNPKVKEQQNVINKKLQNPEIKKKLQKVLNIPRHRFELYVKERNYNDYNHTFKKLLNNKSIVNFIKTRFKSKNISILDEGAGKTFFLRDIKKLLMKEGIDTHTTAITLSKEVTRENTNVDLLVKQKTQEYLLNRKYDLIFSVFGGIHYNIFELNKNVVLKLSHSLSEKGVMFIGVNRLTYSEKFSLDFIVKNISKTLNKNGFDLKFSYVPHNILYKLPVFIFKIERK